MRSFLEFFNERNKKLVKESVEFSFSGYDEEKFYRFLTGLTKKQNGVLDDESVSKIKEFLRKLPHLKEEYLENRTVTFAISVSFDVRTDRWGKSNKGGSREDTFYFEGKQINKVVKKTSAGKKIIFTPQENYTLKKIEDDVNNLKIGESITMPLKCQDIISTKYGRGVKFFDDNGNSYIAWNYFKKYIEKFGNLSTSKFRGIDGSLKNIKIEPYVVTEATYTFDVKKREMYQNIPTYTIDISDIYCPLNEILPILEEFRQIIFDHFDPMDIFRLDNNPSVKKSKSFYAIKRTSSSISIPILPEQTYPKYIRLLRRSLRDLKEIVNNSEFDPESILLYSDPKKHSDEYIQKRGELLQRDIERGLFQKGDDFRMNNELSDVITDILDVSFNNENHGRR